MTARLDNASMVLLDRFQHSFPLIPAPFAEAGDVAGVDGERAILRYRSMINAGLISRIGAVVAPNSIGVSTLAAMAVPAAEIERVAQIISDEPGVNHNYERENTVNLWFVVTAPTEEELAATLSRIEKKSGIRVLDLRLEEAFHLDLGFSLAGDGAKRKRLATPDVSALCAEDREMLAAIEDGIPLVKRPYRQIGEAIGWSEEFVLARLGALVEANVIRRFGVVVRHRALGMNANAMAVWDVDDEEAHALGERLALEPGVTLCYRRRRDFAWPYNLYCMVHGSQRAATLDVVDRLHRLSSGAARGHAVLFSNRCFKQTGARFGKRRQAS